MDLKKALDILIHPMEKENLVLQYEAYETISKAVERDTARKPYDISFDHKREEKRLYTCPHCRNMCLKKWQNERQINNFCGDCGQRIDWSET